MIWICQIVVGVIQLAVFGLGVIRSGYGVFDFPAMAESLLQERRRIQSLFMILNPVARSLKFLAMMMKSMQSASATSRHLIFFTVDLMTQR
jgi:hypothetical protein